jgi:hypothetical protein
MNAFSLEAMHQRVPSYRSDPERPPRRYTAMSRGASEVHLLVDEVLPAHQ